MEFLDGFWCLLIQERDGSNVADNYLTAMQHVRLPTLEISPVIIPLISPDLAVYLTLCPCFTGILHSCMRTPGSFRM
jgi:hypothetical protein